jgi:hypothetical protein
VHKETEEAATIVSLAARCIMVVICYVVSQFFAAWGGVQ